MLVSYALLAIAYRASRALPSVPCEVEDAVHAESASEAAAPVIAQHGRPAASQAPRPVTPKQAAVALVAWMRQTGNTGCWCPDQIDMFWRLTARHENLEMISPQRVREAFAVLAKPGTGCAFEGVVRIDLDKRYANIRAEFPSRQRSTVYTVLPRELSNDLPAKSEPCKSDESALQLLVGTERRLSVQSPPVARKGNRKGRRATKTNRADCANSRLL